MCGALLLLAMTRAPCLPVELGQIPTPSAEVPLSARPPSAALRDGRPPPPVPVAVAARETTRYTVAYGPLTIGEIRLQVAGAGPGAATVAAGGRGEGGLLGLGRIQNVVATQFDLARLDSRRWVDGRTGDRALNDHVDQAAPGQVAFARERLDPAGPVLRSAAMLPGPLLDPLGFLLRLRVAPPGATPQILYVLDGQALWRVTVTNAGRAPFPEPGLRVPTLRLDAQAEPIRYDGSVSTDPERRHRSFSLWLSDDGPRVPLRVEMPLGLSTVVVSLAEISRR
jgi:hypothetical protein